MVQFTLKVYKMITTIQINLHWFIAHDFFSLSLIKSFHCAHTFNYFINFFLTHATWFQVLNCMLQNYNYLSSWIYMVRLKIWRKKKYLMGILVIPLSTIFRTMNKNNIILHWHISMSVMTLMVNHSLQDTRHIKITVRTYTFRSIFHCVT